MGKVRIIWRITVHEFQQRGTKMFQNFMGRHGGYSNTI